MKRIFSRQTVNFITLAMYLVCSVLIYSSKLKQSVYNLNKIIYLNLSKYPHD